MADVPVHINVDTEAVVEAVMKIVRVGMERVRAEVAEGIARAIEAVARRDKHGVSAWVYGYRDGLDDAAAIARNYTVTATGTPDSDVPAQPTQERTLS